MKEIIIIKENIPKIKQILDQKHCPYEIHYQENQTEITDQELETAYREAWSNPQRMAEFKKWEELALDSWKKRENKENK
ncbi:hypothetical protein [endosymbiont GvMRE of Glomus versiforme]|uniref:hypothetical protein n=1 Tax=endosymbiont GvMRE of Glomus versiforme TaxID=2039283 RepID=UPI000ED05264|nr:hypothetical protein [endosymbiont GvMRE of Glomus versiforme]RHZ36314.1 hypothetical protein GvMRE_Ic1g47 [endosymbiont GvMRE of Glomus versiforme]RHZ37723.1 hypothetical protein GvMRE_I1g689 [endosymbiont GvMRE of Glomus versiforme]